MHAITEIITSLNSIFWGWLVAGILLGTGCYYTIRLFFPQIRYFSKLYGNLRESMRATEGVSGFGALCAALGGQVGTGSLVGVATALFSGGPGAIFWMWVTALLGMTISFGEAVLAQLFRESNGDGTYRGGPAYYIMKGLNNKILATGFCISIIMGIGFCYVMIQSSSVALAAEGLIPSFTPLHMAIVQVVLVALIVFGGVKRLADVASWFVPIMALVYIAVTVYIVLANLTELPHVIGLIFGNAFKFEAAAGGVAGHTIREAFRYGVARGLFSNDAGSGTAPGVHATAIVNHPVNQGFAAMLGTFFTTIIVCSCTAFSILLTGSLESGETGINLTQLTFHNAVGEWGKYVVFFAMFTFGFTSLISCIYYGEINIQWFRNSKVAVNAYRIFAMALTVVSIYIPVNSLWELADFSSAFMVFFNVTALFLLFKYVRYALKDYERQIKEGVEKPKWDYDSNVIELMKK